MKTFCMCSVKTQCFSKYFQFMVVWIHRYRMCGYRRLTTILSCLLSLNIYWSTNELPLLKQQFFFLTNDKGKLNRKFNSFLYALTLMVKGRTDLICALGNRAVNFRMFPSTTFLIKMGGGYRSITSVIYIISNAISLLRVEGTWKWVRQKPWLG
jgi:hypothetical protein